MRKQLLGLLVPLLAMVVVAGAADMTGKGVSASAALQRLAVRQSQDGLRVEFKSTVGTLAPKNEVRAIIEASVFTGTSAIGSGICGSSGKLSRDMPAMRVRDRPRSEEHTS